MSDFDGPARRGRSSRSNADEQEPPWLNQEEQLPPIGKPERHEQAPAAPSDWRSRTRRSTTTRRKARRTVRNSPQELQLWLQRGGWIYAAAAAILLIVALVVVLSFDRTAQTNPFARTPVAEDGTGDGASAGSASGDQPTPQPTITIAPVQPLTTTRELFIVYNTDGLGLKLRADHSTDSRELATLRDGTRVEQIGEDYIGADYTWRQVRTPDGKEGWVAVEWLQKAPADE